MLSKIIVHVSLGLCLLAAAGCNKDKAEEAASGPKATDESPGSSPGKEAALGGALSTSSIETRLPSDAAIVMSISLGRARQTGAYKLYEKKLLAEMAEPISDTRKACGLGLDSVDGTISVAVAGYEGAAKKDVTILFESKTLTRQTIEECVSSLGAMKGGKITVENDGKLTRYTSSKDKDPLVVAWLSDKAVLVHANINSGVKIAAVVDGSSQLKNNATLVPLLARVNRDGVAWVVGAIPASGKAKFSKLIANADPLGFYASVDYKDALSATLGVRFADGETAQRVVTAAKGLLELSKARPEVAPFVAYFEKLELAADGSDFTAKIKLSAAEVTEAMTRFGRDLGLPSPQ